LRVHALTESDLFELANWIEGAAIDLYLSQPLTDQRHGIDSARFVVAGGGTAEAVAAALFHDVGKRHARLGVLGRTAATLLSRLGLPAPGRLGVYLDHGELGAKEIAELGFGPLVVDFARHHHGSRPATISQADWDLLVAADLTVVGRKPAGG
jgi:putative nucleotidyltransferase with HDIG domain